MLHIYYICNIALYTVALCRVSTIVILRYFQVLKTHFLSLEVTLPPSQCMPYSYINQDSKALVEGQTCWLMKQKREPRNSSTGQPIDLTNVHEHLNAGRKLFSRSGFGTNRQSQTKKKNNQKKKIRTPKSHILCKTKTNHESKYEIQNLCKKYQVIFMI